MLVVGAGILLFGAVKAGLGLINGSAELKRTYTLTQRSPEMKAREEATGVSEAGTFNEKQYFFSEEDFERLTRCTAEVPCLIVYKQAEERAEAYRKVLLAMGVIYQGSCGHVHATKQG